MYNCIPVYGDGDDDVDGGPHEAVDEGVLQVCLEHTGEFAKGFGIYRLSCLCAEG